ncbi:hypothetical protein BGZ60DRAFT_409930 [Tricladium varicosporioides]|nr:hypothetical protein BGZ60DRAFT_409930 [Hymenoscyphus varicosporioides]
MTRKYPEPRKELTQAQRADVWRLHLEGYNPSQIFRKTGIPRTTCNSLIARYTLCPDPEFKNRPRHGRPKLIS